MSNSVCLWQNELKKSLPWLFTLLAIREQMANTAAIQITAFVEAR